MDETSGADRFGPLRLLALAIARTGRLALLAGGRSRWHTNAGYTFVPLELPGCVQEPGTLPHTTADGLGRRTLGRAARLIASRQLYGPSEVHRIDRLPTQLGDEPLPLLRLEREAPLHVAATPTLRRVIVTVYRARLIGPPALTEAAGGGDVDDGASGLLWLAPDALRLAMRGMPFAELLAQPAVEWLPATARAAALPDDALVYVPAEYGERHLLRLVAKYGPEALFQDDDAGWEEPQAEG
ncbi:MAG TPA: hypothetical protein VF116_00760 [Ktedonobacterales bacterium]